MLQSAVLLPLLWREIVQGQRERSQSVESLAPDPEHCSGKVVELEVTRGNADAPGELDRRFLVGAPRGGCRDGAVGEPEPPRADQAEIGRRCKPAEDVSHDEIRADEIMEYGPPPDLPDN